VSLAWPRHDEASACACARASACRWHATAPVVRLESQSTRTCLYPACATPPSRGEPATSCQHVAAPSGRDPLTCAAGPRWSDMCTVACSPCTGFCGKPTHDSSVWYPRTLCRRARFDRGGTLPWRPLRPFASGSVASLSGPAMLVRMGCASGGPRLQLRFAQIMRTVPVHVERYQRPSLEFCFLLLTWLSLAVHRTPAGIPGCPAASSLARYRLPICCCLHHLSQRKPYLWCFWCSFFLLQC